jgi:hypothetical protein
VEPCTVDPLGREPRQGVRLGTLLLRSEAPSVVPGGSVTFASLLDLLARLSTRGEQYSHADSLDLLRDAHVEGASAPPELDRFGAIFRLRCSVATKDASGRLMQPTFSKTSTHALCSERRDATAEPCAAAGPAFQHRRAHLLPAGPAGPPECYRLHGTNGGWVLTPRRRLIRAVRVSAESSPATKIVCLTAPIEERWIPDPRRLPPVGSPVGPLAGCVRVAHVSGLRRPFARCA